MPELIATCALKNPRPIAKGERFIVSEKTARLLKRIRKAIDAPARQQRTKVLKVASDTLELDESRGRYNRSDMRATD